jgi:hypothetical protein
MLAMPGRLGNGDQFGLAGKSLISLGTDCLFGGFINGGVGGRPCNMTSIEYREPAWHQRDTRFDPAVLLTWILGMGVAVFIATAL